MSIQSRSFKGWKGKGKEEIRDEENRKGKKEGEWKGERQEENRIWKEVERKEGMKLGEENEVNGKGQEGKGNMSGKVKGNEKGSGQVRVERVERRGKETGKEVGKLGRGKVSENGGEGRTNKIGR